MILLRIFIYLLEQKLKKKKKPKCTDRVPEAISIPDAAGSLQKQLDKVGSVIYVWSAEFTDCWHWKPSSNSRIG